MRKMKKINFLILFVFVLFGFILINLNIEVLAADKKVDNGKATYRVEQTIEEFDLGYGIHYQREKAFSSVVAGHHAGQAAGSGGGGDLVSGQEYQQQVNVLDIDFESPAEFVPYAGITPGTWNTLTVRKAAAEFELKNPGKMVIAAVNGDWFEISRDVKASVGVTISNGEYYKSVTGYPNIHTLAFNNSGNGKKITEITDRSIKPVLTIYDQSGNEIKTIDINKVNQEPGNNEISLFYPNLKPEDSYSKKYQNISVNDAWVVTNASASITPVSDCFYGKGKISKQSGSYELINGKFAIKTNNSEIDSLLKEEVVIRCQYVYANEAYKDVENAICYPYAVMKNGEHVYPVDATTTNNDAKYRKPRTMIGQREDGSIILATVDGRQPTDKMFGMTSAEMAALIEYYGCVDSWKLDGGGSSTMIIRKQSGMNISASFNDSSINDWHVVNSPSDKSERSDGNCLLVVVDVPEVTVEVSEITSEYVVLNVALLTQIERYNELYILQDGKQHKVVNGQVKINLEPGISYKLMVYGMEKDQLNNLGKSINVEAAELVPTELSMTLALSEKNGKKIIEIYYRLNNKESVRKIEFYINDEKISTYNNRAYVDQSQEFYNILKGLDIEVVVLTSPFIGEQVIKFEDVDVSYALDFLYEEMLFTTTNIIEDIFVLE